MKIYDGEGAILGRLASAVAKEILLGEEVKVVNCEKVVISGRKTNTFAREKQRRERKGYPLKSATYSRLPDRFVRRTIRGMLPWKKARGKQAYRRVLCYRGLPTEFSGQAMVTLKEASSRKLPTLKFTTVGKICQLLGGKSS